jgi:hypothetical protein
MLLLFGRESRLDMQAPGRRERGTFMTDTSAQRNIDNAKLLLEDAMPNGNFDLMRSLVTEDAPILRAGFADLYALTDDAIPQRGNFIEWLDAGWKVLSGALSDQTADTTSIVGDEHTVVIQYHMTALHTGTFAGAPATGNRVTWDEVGVLHFNSDNKITDLWFMCQELSLAEQIGYRHSLA